jgi:hypothetical protein
MEILIDFVRILWHALVAAVGDITLEKIIGGVLFYLIIHPLVSLVVFVWRIINRLYIKSLKFMSRPLVRRFERWVYKNGKRATYYRQAREILFTSGVVAIDHTSTDPDSAPGSDQHHSTHHL